LVVSPESKLCPPAPDEIAEAYLMGTLPNEQMAAFEDHYVVCNSCATVVETTATYVDGICTAAKKLRTEPLRAASTSSAC
jgi:hypothetical protein